MPYTIVLQPVAFMSENDPFCEQSALSNVTGHFDDAYFCQQNARALLGYFDQGIANLTKRGFVPDDHYNYRMMSPLLTAAMIAPPDDAATQLAASEKLVAFLGAASDIGLHRMIDDEVDLDHFYTFSNERAKQWNSFWVVDGIGYPAVVVHDETAKTWDNRFQPTLTHDVCRAYQENHNRDDAVVAAQSLITRYKTDHCIT